MENLKVKSAELQKDKRVLHINAGVPVPGNVVDEIRAYGYEINLVQNAKLGTPSSLFNNNRDLGFYSDSRFLGRDMNENLAKATGVRLPAKYSPDEALKLGNSVVAKDVSRDRFEGVFFLPEQRHVEAFVNGCPDLSQWIFQEYVESPSEYNTYFRVVVDGFGKIHYGVLMRSGLKKGEGKTAEGVVNIIPRTTEGRQKIWLNGQPILDEENKKVLIAHGISPDNPKIPELIAKDSSLIGIALRGHYPFVGLDFIYDKKLRHYLLEFNARPGLDPEAFGVTQEQIDKIPGDHSYVQLYFEKDTIKRMFEA